MAFPTFPTTPVLDDFSRPNENPLSYGGRWVRADSIGDALRLTSFEATGGSDDWSYWTPQQYTDFEVYVTRRSSGSTDSIRLHCITAGAGSNGSQSGYGLHYLDTGDSFSIQRLTFGSLTQLAVVSVSFAANNSMLFRRLGSSLTGWLEVSGVWTQVVEATDSVHSGAGRLALFLSGPGTTRADNFGGGIPRQDAQVPPRIGGRGAGW